MFEVMLEVMLGASSAVMFEVMLEGMLGASSAVMFEVMLEGMLGASSARVPTTYTVHVQHVCPCPTAMHMPMPL